MPRKVYKRAGNEIISFMKRKGNNYELQYREIRGLYRDEVGDLYVRINNRYKKLKYSKNKKVGLFVVL